MCAKKTIISLLILFVNFGAIAQPFTGGIIGGLSASQVDGDKQKGYNKLGVYAGVYVAFDFNDKFGFKIETFYMGKGAKKVVNKIEELKSQLNYIEMPFMLSFKANDKIRLNAGLSGSYLINSKLFEQGYEISTDSYDIHSFDWGSIASCEYYFTEKLAFNLRFEYSLVPFRNKARRWYNNAFSFGLQYKL